MTGNEIACPYPKIVGKKLLGETEEEQDTSTYLANKLVHTFPDLLLFKVKCLHNHFLQSLYYGYYICLTVFL